MNIETEVLYPTPEPGAGIAANQKHLDQLAIHKAAFAARGGKTQVIPDGVSKFGIPDFKELSDRNFRGLQDAGRR